MKNKLLFCTGVSGCGKSYFIQNILPENSFYNLKSATTRAMREEEKDGREYYFRDESYFETEKFATKLFVNEAFWKLGDKKWLYGVPEFEIFNNLGRNFTYDVIEPKYVRQMIDWFDKKGLLAHYDYTVLWFLPNMLNQDIVQSRQNMPNDTLVRANNTCVLQDFENVRLRPDFCIKRSPLNEERDIYRPEAPDKKYTLDQFFRQIGCSKTK